MAKISKKWGRLVARWDEVEASLLSELYAEGTSTRSRSPKTYALLEAIYEKPKKAPKRTPVMPDEL